MWGTSSRGDELTGDFANELDAISTDDRGLFRLSAGKLSQGNLGLLQQNSPNRRHASASQRNDATEGHRVPAGGAGFVGMVSDRSLSMPS